jgi:hypothetical protein
LTLTHYRKTATAPEASGTPTVNLLYELVEKVEPSSKNVPERLKPQYEGSTYGTAEAVPLSKTDFNKL